MTYKKAFTLIELIFTIVIIGILSAVTIQKLAINRTNSMATVCKKEVGVLLSELVVNYAKRGYESFSNTPIEEMTNIQALGVSETGKNYILSGKKVDADGVDYYCDGEAVVNFKTTLEGSSYLLQLTSYENQTSPAAVEAARSIKKYITNNQTTRKIAL